MASGSNVRKALALVGPNISLRPKPIYSRNYDFQIGDLPAVLSSLRKRRASGDHVWDSVVKWKDALRRHRSAESRKRYDETLVPSEGSVSWFSIRREINIRTDSDVQPVCAKPFPSLLRRLWMIPEL